ncbi:FecR family protein [Sunxiuqinia elliptica]
MIRYIEYKRIAKLIAEEFKGNLSASEKEKLDGWLKETPENRALYHRLKQSSNFQEWQDEIELFGQQRNWSELYLRIKKKEKKDRRNRFLKYAAVFLIPAILLGGVLGYVMNHVGEEQETISPVAKISPGTNKAFLIMDNGETVLLDSKEEMQLKEKDGTTIAKRKGQLTYAPTLTQEVPKPLYNTIQTPKGGEYNVTLADGSVVYVNSMSKLKFPVTFVGETREVSLEGEACFKVKKDESRPFIVNVNGVKIEVLGTTFNVNAYNDESQLVTTLVEGKIQMEIPGDNDKPLLLCPDEQVIYSSVSSTIQKNKVDASNYVQWIDGILVFENKSLEEIMRTLSRWYDFTYSFEKASIGSIHFDGGLNKYKSIEPILEIIESTGKVKINIDGKKITFMERA